MAALDLLGRRWALRVLWELYQQPAGFRDLQARCDGMSASVLSTRLKELEEAGLAATSPAGWTLTPRGRALIAALQPLSDWAEGWARGGDGREG